MSKIKAIILDLDGVIIESEKLWTKADLNFLKHYRIDITLKDYEKRIKYLIMGLAFQEGVYLMKKYFNLKGDIEEVTSQRRLLVKAALEDVVLMPGFEEFHKSIKEKYKMAVATSMTRYFLDSIIFKFNLTELFNNHIYSIEDIGYISKPRSDIYLHTARMLNVKSAECVGIEDSPKGVEAVNSAGMHSVAITTTTPRHKLSHANIIVNSFSEINLDSL